MEQSLTKTPGPRNPNMPQAKVRDAGKKKVNRRRWDGCERHPADAISVQEHH